MLPSPLTLRASVLRNWVWVLNLPFPLLNQRARELLHLRNIEVVEIANTNLVSTSKAQAEGLFKFVESVLHEMPVLPGITRRVEIREYAATGSG